MKADLSETERRLIPLTDSQRDLLWRVAQHKYGWTCISRRLIPTADALLRRGLVEYGRHDRDHSEPFVEATLAGYWEILDRWPVSPFILETYDHQPDGWTPKEGVPA